MRALVGAVGYPVALGPGRPVGPLVPDVVGAGAAVVEATVRGSGRNTCRVCGEPIRMMIFRHTGYCCQRCEDVQ